MIKQLLVLEHRYICQRYYVLIAQSEMQVIVLHGGVIRISETCLRKCFQSFLVFWGLTLLGASSDWVYQNKKKKIKPKKQNNPDTGLNKIYTCQYEPNYKN